MSRVEDLETVIIGWRAKEWNRLGAMLFPCMLFVATAWARSQSRVLQLRIFLGSNENYISFMPKHFGLAFSKNTGPFV
ncbi:hypothetical protein DL96DRAFT_1575600 [Flagelloscypha sp. PMI_526]|nr:hypothetical protein DL96DRAFT_1575600 [Flagelloscypha sp. PMI_526]